MKRQTSETRYSASKKASENNQKNTKSDDSSPINIYSNYHVPQVKKVTSLSRNQSRTGLAKALGRELSPKEIITQKTEPIEIRHKNKSSHDIGVEYGMTNKKSSKNQISGDSLLSLSNQQSFENDKPKSALQIGNGKNMKLKNSAPAVKKPMTSSKGQSETPKNIRAQPNQFTLQTEKNTELSGAIFERDEADEEDNKDAYPSQQIFLSEETKILTQNISESQGYFNQKSRDTSDSPTLKPDSNSSSGIFKFRQEYFPNLEANALAASSLAASSMVESQLSSKNPSQVRGAFMNEHISPNQLESRKEKQRLMKEALDIQLMEKKRKLEEEKMREMEENKREEERVKKEMMLLKQKHDKEMAQEVSKKASFKTEEGEGLVLDQNNLKLNKQKSTEKPEKHSSESDKNETRDTSANNSGLYHLNQHKEEQRILMSPVKVHRNVESRNRSLVESRSNGSPIKVNNNMDMLVDENNKLRQENNKKEELIEALIHALKQKEVGGGPNNFHEKPASHGTQRKEQPISAQTSAKTIKTIDISETENGFYGYYLNGYVQPKLKYRAISEHPSDLYRYETKEGNNSATEDKNYSVNIYDKIDMKDYKPKIMHKVMPDYMEPSSNIISPNSSTGSYFKFPVPGNARNNELSNIFGPTPNMRGYSSPLATHLNQAPASPGLQKTESKTGPYMPFISPSNAGHVTLEPIKSASQGSVTTNNLMSPNLFSSLSTSTVVRIKKRQEHSLDFVDPTHTQDPRIPTSYRPVINAINGDGTVPIGKAIQRSGLNSLAYSFSPLNFPTQEAQKIEIIDTSKYPGPLDDKAGAIEAIQGTDLNAKPFGKINVYNGEIPKKASTDLARDKWIMNEISPQKKPQKEEYFDKSNGLPALEGKPKFPKDVFSSNIRKKIYP